MYKRVVPNINTNMSAVAYNVTRLNIIDTYSVSYTALCAGGMRKRNTKRCIYRHYKSGTIRTICQTASAVYIRISDKLACIIGNCLPIGTGRSTVTAITG